MILDPIARNAERARRAADALAQYGTPTDELGPSDLLADLMLLAEHEDVDFQEWLAMTTKHFRAETAGEL